MLLRAAIEWCSVGMARKELWAQQKQCGVVCATRRHQRVKAVERPPRARDLRRRGLHGRGQPWPLGAMAQAVEAPSAMDGSAVGRRARELFSLLSRFGRAAVTIYSVCRVSERRLRELSGPNSRYKNRTECPGVSFQKAPRARAERTRQGHVHPTRSGRGGPLPYAL